ncbi:hypothetical protein BH23GEM7_BH23GEM7_08520 [soil metagenome]
MLILKRTILTAAAALTLLAPGVHAQSLLDRPPNLSGNWVGGSGTMYFNFLHRFTASPAPERKVANAPSFVLAVGLPARTLLGAHYATNSRLAPRYPNEWEFFVRNMPFAQENGAPFDVAGQAGYNLAAEGIDGELSLARRQGPLRLVGAGRLISDPLEVGETRFAVAGGAVLRLGRYVAVAGDLASLLSRREGELAAWSAGLHLALPYTPHTLSLQAANTNAATLQGISRGEDQVRYGFEFTVPITLRRWFGGGSPVAPMSPSPAPAAAEPARAGELALAGMRNLAYTPARLEIAAGTTVEWRNQDVVAHTVTAEEGGFDSGLIEPGSTWRHTFHEPGIYSFLCTPHPFMKGVVVVR